MGLLSSNIVFIPFILLLAFFGSRQDRSWLVLSWRSFVSAWIVALLLVIGALFLPTYQWIDSVVSSFPKPFDALYTIMIDLFPLLALILATLFLFNGLARVKQKPTPAGENGTGKKPFI